METIWKVVEACIMPIITYAGEVWETKQKDYKTANTILENILKRILKTPKGTPREALYIETGLLDPESIIKKNRLSMESRIKKGINQTMKEILNIRAKGSWADDNEKLKKELNIEDEDLIQSNYKTKNIIKEKMNAKFKDMITESAENKSKMKYYFEGKQSWKPQKRSRYMDKLTRNQASVIFKARTRMLTAKSNYKNGYKDLTCRLCKKYEETQNHILEECEKMIELPRITKEMIFSEDVKELKETVSNVMKRIEILEEETTKHKLTSK